jgi:peptide/nickel transport system ATP-binding protein
MAKAPVKDKTGLLLDIRNLRIEATSYPPGEAPRTVTLVENVSLTWRRARCLA